MSPIIYTVVSTSLCVQRIVRRSLKEFLSLAESKKIWKHKESLLQGHLITCNYSCSSFLAKSWARVFTRKTNAKTGLNFPVSFLYSLQRVSFEFGVPACVMSSPQRTQILPVLSLCIHGSVKQILCFTTQTRTRPHTYAHAEILFYTFFSLLSLVVSSNFLLLVVHLFPMFGANRYYKMYLQ